MTSTNSDNDMCVGLKEPCAPEIIELDSRIVPRTSLTVEKEAETNTHIHDKPATRSKIYDLFNFNSSTNSWTCKNCKKSYAVNKSRGPSSLHNHVKQKHPSLLIPPKDEIKESSKRYSLFQHKPKTREALTENIFREALVKFVVESNQPFTLVEEDGFKHLINLITRNEEHTRIPSARTLKDWVVRMHKEEQESLKARMHNNSSKISFTIDCWTSANQYPFQGIIATWINNEWELTNAVLDLTILHGSHTGSNIASSFLEVLTDFGLVEKLSSIVSDSASNMDKACSEIEAKLSESGHSFETSKHRIRCFAHILNLTCQAILSEAGDSDLVDEDELEAINQSLTLIQKLRKAVVAIRGSPQRRETFAKQCEISGMDSKNLVRDVRTRWNSTFLMIERACEMKTPLLLTLSSHKELRSLSVLDAEWDILKQLMELLRPFKEATEVFSTEKHPTMSEVTGVYLILFKHLEKFMESEVDEVLRTPATKGWNKLFKYYPTCDGDSYIIATVLDPRCKMQWYTDHQWRTEWLSNCKRTVKRVWTNDYKPTEADAAIPVVHSVSLFSQHSLFGSTNDSNVRKDELQRYLSEPRVQPQLIDNDPSGGGILAWWKTHQNEFPNLSRMAKDYLAVPSSAVSVERLFSNGKDLVSHRRESMNPETIRICMCLKNWLSMKRKIVAK